MVISERTILHGIDKYEFLDSPEYESSRGALKDKFRVSYFVSFRENSLLTFLLHPFLFYKK